MRTSPQRSARLTSRSASRRPVRSRPRVRPKSSHDSCARRWRNGRRSSRNPAPKWIDESRTMKLPGHDRYDYAPIIERKDYDWPGGKRLAFVVTTNLAWHAFGKGRGHDNAKHGEPQTQRNYSWRDYGNR